MEYIMFRRLSTVLISLTLTFTSIFAAPFKVAIANLGSHKSLIDVVNGIESKAKELGLDVIFDVQHVNFDMTQIPKMLTAFKAKKPDILITLTTSVTQHAKTIFRGTSVPIVFAAITDPVEAKLLTFPNTPTDTMMGVSDRQDAASIIAFIKHHLPCVKRIGIPFAQNEANDRALLESFKTAAKDIDIVPIPVDNLQDLPHRIRAAASSVDALYVGPSNMIQPALPVIIQQANRANVPVFNFNEAAVTSHQALGSFSVSYMHLGHAVAKILKELMDGKSISLIAPIYPNADDHYGTVSSTVAKRLKISLPSKPYPNVTYVGQ
jgi:putative tryptophan/tyrosine transport system substrate-binding protein